ncbi:GNAT family N-acetyltransferase [Streptomyces sp. NPDC090022]|uniref:GNAT family N-acetyltransferase n=1 Tax=Streptomyces sp. NPDC090022 TaxID=3365920 RepID=UPI003801B47A
MTTTLRPSGPLQQNGTGARSRPYEIRVNSRRVGSLVIAADTPMGPRVGELRELYVDEGDRRRGRATVAALAAEEVLRGWGCRHVRATVPAASEAGIRLARALGYPEEGRTMRKALPAEAPALPAGVRLRRMTDQEYEDWFRGAVEDYAARCVERGMTPDAALAHAREDSRALLPRGQDTPGSSVAALEVDGTDVGRLWMAERELAPGVPGWYVFDVKVLPAHRGRGHGRTLLLQAERTALAAGAGWIGLHRFSDNTPAVRLYDSLGYRTASVNFAKILL